ncbi:MAG TPA: MalY/PatB family protein [Jatrophihabitantaceae bacterium]|nr:MalY/PatB family protein [Jatrophihabitantaceae bacterium]
MNPFDITIERLRTRTSMKWRQYPADVLPLWVAEMDVELAEPVIAAVTNAVHAGDTGYPLGVAEYAQALAAFAEDRWGWHGIDVDRSAIVADVMVGVTEVLRLITSPGDGVVVNCPVYPPFYAFIEHAGRRVVEAPLSAESRLDLDTLERVFADARPAAYLLCSPHNPTGTVHTRDELAAVASLADRYGVRVVADEIHAPLVLAGASYTPYLAVPGSESAVSLYSASKGWNLAGLKAAVAIGGVDAAHDLARLPEIVSHGPTHLGVIAHVAALRAGGEWLNALLAGLDENRALLERLVAERLPGVRLRRPEATFLSWLDFRGVAGLPPDDGAVLGDVRTMGGPAAYLLEHARVALNSGATFGSGGAGHARLNYGTSPTILTEAIDRIAAALPT